MIRAIAFVTALVISAGAVAPAVFAADLPSIPLPEDNISIWDTGSTSVNDPYNAEDLFEYSNNFWGDLFDDGRFNNVTVSDNQRYLVELGVSKYVSTHSDEEVNGVMTSYFDDIVDYVMANPSDFDIYWTPDGFVSALTGNPYMNLQFGEDFYNNLADYVIANYYSFPSPDRITTATGGIWIKCPFSYSVYRIVGSTSSQGVSNNADVYVSILRSGAVAASYYLSSDSAVYCNFAYINTNNGNASFSGGGPLSNSFTYDNTSYKVNW